MRDLGLLPPLFDISPRCVFVLSSISRKPGMALISYSFPVLPCGSTAWRARLGRPVVRARTSVCAEDTGSEVSSYNSKQNLGDGAGARSDDSVKIIYVSV